MADMEESAEPSGTESGRFIPIDIEPNRRDRTATCTKREKGLAWAVVVVSLIAFGFLCATVYQNRVISDLQGKETECLSESCVTLSSTLLQSVNKSADPCLDFYTYSCGGWMRNNDIPQSKSKWTTFGSLSDKNQKVLRNALDSSFPIDSIYATHAKQFYENCMDLEAIESRSYNPIMSPLQQIGWSAGDEWNANELTFLTNSLTQIAPIGITLLFFSGVGPDDKNSTQHKIFIGQAGLALPKDYYNSTDRSYVNAYKSYIANTFKLIPLLFENEIGSLSDVIANLSTSIIDLETKLAAHYVAEADLRDPVAVYNPRNLSELSTLCPLIDWSAYYEAMFPGNLSKVDSLIVVQTPTYLQGMCNVLQSTSPRLISRYFQWAILRSYAAHLSADFRAQELEYRKAVYGVQCETPRWQSCVSRTDNAVGFVLGKMFVDATFTPDTKQIALSMVKEIKSAFEEGLNHLTWMDAQTRAKSKEKAEAMKLMIAYPDWIMDEAALKKYYQGLTVMEEEYVYSLFNLAGFDLRFNLAKLWKPVDKTEWQMTPSTVNAYYDPSANQMVFPAGILQPPFFSASYPKAYNFGAIGAVIGHELSHGFDDQGSQYDKDGNLQAWWPDKVRQDFEKRTQCVANQYAGYELLPGHFINGDLTLGENIADNAGLITAFNAYRNWASRNKDPTANLPSLNYTPEQLFFLAFSQVWCNLATPQTAINLLAKDPHSPGQFRVIGSIANSREFASTFSCPSGTPSNPVAKCDVWTG